MLLSGLIASGEIGVLGHSDGADVTLAVAADACCRDLRVRAAAILSGAELTSFGGSYFGADSPPLLVSQGNANPINAPACSAQIYDGAPAPKYYLDLLGASHLPPYVDPGRDREIVAQVLHDFFEGELSPRRGVLAALAGAGNVTSLSRLTHAPTAPQATGFCPARRPEEPALPRRPGSRRRLETVSACTRCSSSGSAALISLRASSTLSQTFQSRKPRGRRSPST